MNREKSLCCGAPLEETSVEQSISLPGESPCGCCSGNTKEDLDIDVFTFKDDKKVYYSLEYNRCTPCGMLFTYAN